MTRGWRLRGLLLAALTVLLGLLLPAASASATTSSVPETRVGLSQPVSADIVGVHECITAGQRPVRGPSQLQIVVGNCVAPEGASTVVPRSLDELSQAGAQLDRNGLTQAGRALQKHANRPGNTSYPKVSGGQLNGTGQNVLDDILTNPLTAQRGYVHPSFGPVREFLLPGMGARFDASGRLIGFL